MIKAPFRLAQIVTALACMGGPVIVIAQGRNSGEIALPPLKSSTSLSMPKDTAGGGLPGQGASASGSNQAADPVKAEAPSNPAPGRPTQVAAGRSPRPPAAAYSGYARTASDPSIATCRELRAEELKELTLMAAIQHVICKSPAINQAVMLIEEQKAAVELAQSAFRPQYSASTELATNRIPSSNSGAGSLKSSVTGSFGVSWTLYDAGVRNANLAQSRLSLNSARAGQQLAVLNALNETLRLYVDAATAYNRLDSLKETEEIARQSLEAAKAKYDALVASLAEKLQAETALAQATLERVRGEGSWATTRGALAVAMGFKVNEALEVASISAAFPAIQMRGADEQWISEVREQHPRVRALRADVLSLKARLDSVRADNKGNVSASLGASATKDLSTTGSRLQPVLGGSVVASIPLFDNAQQQARETQAMAQITSRESAVEQAERDISAELWSSVKQLETEGQNLRAAKMLFYAATQSYRIAFGRYKAGVGSIVELLSTQSTLSSARAQVTQAQLAHAQSRLRLEVASGRVVVSR